MEQGHQHRAGIGLRRELAEAILAGTTINVGLLEVSPENWMGIGGRWGRVIEEVASRFQLIAHGLSLSLGSPDPIDWTLVRRVREFLDQFGIERFSEHLAFCSCENAHLYDLLPIPFRDDAVRHVSSRIRDVQNELGRMLYVENISYYVVPGPQMRESEFLSAVVQEANCGLLLDINNVYVNSRNHSYDPYAFLHEIPLDKIGAVHVAGHEERPDGSILDTHGHPVREEVWNLLANVAPVLPAGTPVILERDFNCADVTAIANELALMNGILKGAADASR